MEEIQEISNENVDQSFSNTVKRPKRTTSAAWADFVRLPISADRKKGPSVCGVRKNLLQIQAQEP